MAFANVIFGLPIEGEFDYSIPAYLAPKAKKGMRTWANFNNKKMLGYIVGLSKTSKITPVKPLLDIPDEQPVLSGRLLKLAKEVSEYYGCSWGEAIESSVPEAVRQSRGKLEIENARSNEPGIRSDITLIHDADKTGRWDIYLKEIQKALDKKQSVLFLNTDLNRARKAEEAVLKKFDCSIVFMHRGVGVKKSIEDWLRIKNQKADIVLGVMSAVFAPLENLGLIIIDEEESQNYKNDQVPHYHSRDVAIARAKIENARIILASASPSLEMLHLVRQGKAGYLFLEKKHYPQVQVMDMRRERSNFKKKDVLLSGSLGVALNQALENKGKALIFVNKKGFASSAYCKNCNFIMRCPRCGIILTYHFKENSLICHYCNYKIDAPMICPQCNSSYIRYSGAGAEKIESELHRLYPNAKIAKIDDPRDFKPDEADIFISTQIILKAEAAHFGLVGIVSVDNILNRVDFRSAEKAFSLLVGLLNLAEKSLFIQTNIPKHYCFEALIKQDFKLFYDEELRLRKQLDFPPFKHFILIKVRGREALKVESKAKDIFALLSRESKEKSSAVLNVNPAEHPKLRDNFYWQILVSSTNPKSSIRFIRKSLKKVSHSGLIITIDTDPL
ncbi:MAG: primosomal protein N' [Candidatus Omnitrophica bacterium]|nr:primosomal protein N' [Candidatus Omnitrophota bacterium]MDD5610194.1 primosomal protein N' [Candidatus Omnitrophota bacterium]